MEGLYLSEMETEESYRISREQDVFFTHESEHILLLEVQYRARINAFETIDDLPFWEED